MTAISKERVQELIESAEEDLRWAEPVYPVGPVLTKVLKERQDSISALRELLLWRELFGGHGIEIEAGVEDLGGPAYWGSGESASKEGES